MFEGQPVDEEGPVFQAPWEAQAFALVLALHERGVFSWAEWATALHTAIATAGVNDDFDAGKTYYLHWLTALETLLLSKEFTSKPELDSRKAQWHDAYLHTPHGQAVELRAHAHSQAIGKTK